MLLIFSRVQNFLRRKGGFLCIVLQGQFLDFPFQHIGGIEDVLVLLPRHTVLLQFFYLGILLLQRGDQADVFFRYPVQKLGKIGITILQGFSALCFEGTVVNSDRETVFFQYVILNPGKICPQLCQK